MIYYLSYLFLLIFPVLVAMSYICTPIIFSFSFLKFRVNLPFFLFLSFIFYEYFNLLLSNITQEVNYLAFQGWMLLIVFVYFLYFNIFKRIEYSLFSILCFISVLIGFSSGSSIVNIVNFLKGLFVFPILLSLQAKFKWKLSSAHFVTILSVVFLSLMIHQFQLVVGFEKFFFGMGYDKVYAQRGISSVGQIPIGIMTNDVFSNEQVQRVLGIFLSADKLSYVMYIFNIYALCCLLRFFPKSILLYVLFSIFSIWLLLQLNVKAVLLNYLTVLFSVFLCQFLGIVKFKLRVLIIGSTIFVMVYYLIVYTNVNFSTSGAIQHIWGLVNPILGIFKSLKAFLIGGGIGTAKSAVPLIGDTVSKADAGNESFIGLLVYQLGMSGVMLYFYLINKVDMSFINLPGYNLTSSILLGVCASSFFSEAVLSFFQVSCYLLSIQIVMGFYTVNSKKQKHISFKK